MNYQKDSTMIDNSFLKQPVFGLDMMAKSHFINERLSSLTIHHYQHCIDYRKMLDASNFDPNNITNYQSIPFLPVRLFKNYDLKSVKNDDVIKTMTSSGTTGQEVSKIYLDKNTARLQTKILSKILESFIGKSRLPMIILDSSSVIKDPSMFSARGAGILGFSIFGREKVYALNENMELNLEVLESFLNNHKGKRILLFGFTYMIWQYFYKLLKGNDHSLDLSKGLLIHGGGWKKIEDQSVSKERFKKEINSVCGIENIFDYYGMVEQTGSIFMECESGHLHASIFGDVIIRRSTDFSIADIGEEGIIQVLSVIPESYPGHSLLTEDKGILLGEDDCSCCRKGKYFKITGRVANAEIRGCSDTHE
jgi:phenylacetate-coenzyme A ligase PaaK-like adenylate-forming protein